nr:FCD domain-containing protein [uncultured Sphingomonas sp.]
MRRTLAPRTAEIAARQRSDADMLAILEQAAAMRACADDAPTLMFHDIAFHQAIATPAATRFSRRSSSRSNR